MEARFIAQKAVVISLHEAFLPAPHTGLRLAGLGHDFVGADAVALNRTISARQTCL